MSGTRVCPHILSVFYAGSATASMTLNPLPPPSCGGHDPRRGKPARYRQYPLGRLIRQILLGHNFVSILASSPQTMIIIHLGGEDAVSSATGLPSQCQISLRQAVRTTHWKTLTGLIVKYPDNLPLNYLMQ